MSMLTGFRIASQILSCRRSLVYLSLGGPTLQAVQGAGRPSPGHFDRQGRRRRGRGAPSLKAGEGGGIARERRAPASLSLDRWSVNGVCACTLSSMHARKALFLTASSSWAQMNTHWHSFISLVSQEGWWVASIWNTCMAEKTCRNLSV
jgi:hypothetical protein